jgi:hypothetical protein
MASRKEEIRREYGELCGQLGEMHFRSEAMKARASQMMQQLASLEGEFVAIEKAEKEIEVKPSAEKPADTAPANA